MFTKLSKPLTSSKKESNSRWLKRQQQQHQQQQQHLTVMTRPMKAGLGGRQHQQQRVTRSLRPPHPLTTLSSLDHPALCRDSPWWSRVPGDAPACGDGIQDLARLGARRRQTGDSVRTQVLQQTTGQCPRAPREHRLANQRGKSWLVLCICWCHQTYLLSGNVPGTLTELCFSPIWRSGYYVVDTAFHLANGPLMT